jgi:hypothetical protein
MISDEQAMQQGKESFQTNKQCDREKNHFRRMSNATRKRIISDEQAMQKRKESFQTNEQCNKEKNHFRRTSNATKKGII